MHYYTFLIFFLYKNCDKEKIHNKVVLWQEVDLQEWASKIQ